MIIVVMGVTGAGKTTVGRLLAHQLGWDFLDADDFHPASNLEKMQRGVPLNDDARQPWLERLHVEMAGKDSAGRDVVLACSALKDSYRAMLAADLAVKFVYLKGSPDLIARRLSARQGHFADRKILGGQFADLEEPHDAVAVDIAAPPESIATEIRMRLGL